MVVARSRQCSSEKTLGVSLVYCLVVYHPREWSKVICAGKGEVSSETEGRIRGTQEPCGGPAWAKGEESAPFGCLERICMTQCALGAGQHIHSFIGLVHCLPKRGFLSPSMADVMGHCGVCCGIPGLYPPDDSSTPYWWRVKRSLDIARCSLGDKIASYWEQMIQTFRPCILGN